MNLRDLALRTLRGELSLDNESIQNDQQRDWELQEEIISMGSEIEELKKLVEDLSNENCILRNCNEGLEMLLNDLQISVYNTHYNNSKYEH